MINSITDTAMNPLQRATPWILTAVIALIIGVLAMGYWQGELRVPLRGFQVGIQRSSNPLGFYALVGLYLGLAGLSTYVLMLILTHAPRSTATTPLAPQPGKRMNLAGRLQFAQDGRCGQVMVTLDSGRHAFAWEFGGGDCIAIVDVPSAEHWDRVAALGSLPRSEFLHALAQEIGRHQCPGARYVISARAIEFMSNTAR
jgi:hypothetical protein